MRKVSDGVNEDDEISDDEIDIIDYKIDGAGEYILTNPSNIRARRSRTNNLR